MTGKCIVDVRTPQLEKLHRGKVRDSFRVDRETRLVVVTDRISCFDRVLDTPIPSKGAVLNKLSNYWFEKTSKIIQNHFIKEIDPQATLVREAVPLRVEMIVRGYLTGSMYRGYEEGKRVFSGVRVPSGLSRNDPFRHPVVTPTTKEENDREITPDEIVARGLVRKKILDRMYEISLALFEEGTKILSEKGFILVDTKYEFGLIDGKLALIDEIHTPDSSRFWRKEDYKKSKLSVEQADKEYVRAWLMANKKDGEMPSFLPDSVIAETERRYREIYRAITGHSIQECLDSSLEPAERLYRNLVKEKIIRDGFIALVMGSENDFEHAKKMGKEILAHDITPIYRVISAHKNGERIIELAGELNSSLEPGAVIAIAGRSNGLGGALAANLVLPVINCPPFKDSTDILLNINSSLMMPSETPASTVVFPELAAHAALRSLNLRRLKTEFADRITKVKKKLLEADRRVREVKE